MSLKEFTERVKQAVRRVTHFSATIALAERRIKRWREEYMDANHRLGKRGLTDAQRRRAEEDRTDARKRIIYWKARKFKAEDLRRNWRDILSRRRAQKKRFIKNHPPVDSDGFAEWRGVPVAPWMVGAAPGPNGTRVNWLQKYVDHGWSGEINSGVRTPEHSEELCLQMCGASSCPGRCAGRSSNHNCTDGCPYPQGAIDVGDFNTFKAIGPMIGSPLRNDLPIDPVHFSVSGH